MRVGLRAAAILAVGALLVMASPSARGDHDELQERLRLAQVPPAMASSIHATVDRAVSHLLAHQRQDGSFEYRRDYPFTLNRPDRSARTAVTALTALALLHVDTPVARGGAKRAIDYLIPKGRARQELRYRVIPASLTVPVLALAGKHPRIADELARRLQGAMDGETGLWGYGMLDGARRDENLIPSHFASRAVFANGYTKTWPWVWRNHLKGIVQSGRALLPRTGGGPRNPIATMVAASSVVLGRAAIVGDPAAQQALSWTEPIMRSIDDSVGADGQTILELVRGERRRTPASASARPGMRPGDPETHLDLYLLGTACILADVEELHGVRWYESAAEVLISRQNHDGGWGGAGAFAAGRKLESDTVETCFALLFLVRSAAVFHPSRPRPLRVGNAPGAGRPRTPAPPTAEARERAPARTPLKTAWLLLGELEQLLDDERAAAELVSASVRDVGFAYHTLSADRPGTDFATQAKRWREGAELLLVRAMVTPRFTQGSFANVWTEVNRVAADTLSGTHAKVAKVMRGAIERELLEPTVRVPAPEVYAAAFRALARLGDPASLPWLVRRGVTAERTGAAAERTIAALDAVSVFQGAPGAIRMLTAWDLVRRFPDPSNGRRTPQEKRERERYEQRVRPAALRALRALCKDPRTGRIPGVPDLWTTSFADFQTWLPEHADGDLPPWSE